MSARRRASRDAATIGRRLALLYTTALVSAAMDRDPGAAADARAMAEMLLDGPIRRR
jgi:hypothetical protein